MPKRTNWKMLSIITLIATLAFGGISIFQQVKYNEAQQQLQKAQERIKLEEKAEEQQVLADAQSGKKDQLTTSDIQKATKLKECFLGKQSGSMYKGEAEIMKSISLNPNELVTGTKSSFSVFRWTATPRVVDSQCNRLKITDIKTGDILNIYTSSIGSGELVGVQKM